jgi:hypothetical protein
MYWIGFRKNSTDAALRDEEVAALLRLLASCEGRQPTQMLEALIPENDVDFGDGTAPVKKSLREKCMAVVLSKAAAEALELLTRQGGIRSLMERGRLIGAKFCLLHHDSPVWKEPRRGKFISLVHLGKDNPYAYDNVREYFDILIQGLDVGFDWLRREEISSIVSDEKIVELLWHTVTSRPIQYRMRMSFIEARQRLVQYGVPEASLPLTEELQSRLDEHEQGTPKPASSSRQRCTL